MTLSELIGQTLAEKIIEKGYNYSTYAKELGVTQGYISQIVNGYIKSIKIETLEKLVQPLDMSVGEFLMEIEKKKSAINVPFTEEEIKGIVENLPNGEERSGLLRKLRKLFPTIPEWLKFENHVKYVQENFENDLIPGATAGKHLHQKEAEQE